MLANRRRSSSVFIVKAGENRNVGIRPKVVAKDPSSRTHEEGPPSPPDRRSLGLTIVTISWYDDACVDGCVGRCSIEYRNKKSYNENLLLRPRDLWEQERVVETCGSNILMVFDFEIVGVNA